MRAQRVVFTVAVTIISWVFILRDRLLGRIGRSRPANAPQGRASRHTIPCGAFLVDAVSVLPAAAPVKAALLICHGIGETVDHWLAAQNLLAEHGVGSLVFDYSGYGKSTGAVDWSRCERNAVSAFEFLASLLPGVPISLLGFSLGSGVATAILQRIQVDRLILGSAFTSFRDAACALGLPRAFASVLPPVWDSEEPLRECAAPVLVIHCERDRLFPVRMAAELASRCGGSAEVVVVPGQAHNEPFYRPQMSYWGHILSRLLDYPPAPSASNIRREGP